jgi:Tfp pilus assembly protein PilO
MKNQKKQQQSLLKTYTDKINKMHEPERQKFSAYLYVIFSLLTLSFFGIFAIRPTLSTISRLNQQYEASQRIYEQLIVKSNALKTLDTQYQQLTPDLPIIYAAVPRTTLMAYLTRQIEMMAQDNNLVLASLTFGPVEVYPADKANPALYSFTFTASLEGEEDNIKKFISEIIQFDRLVNIEQLNTGNLDNGEYGMSITGKVYFSKN